MTFARACLLVGLALTVAACKRDLMPSWMVDLETLDCAQYLALPAGEQSDAARLLLRQSRSTTLSVRLGEVVSADPPSEDMAREFVSRVQNECRAAPGVLVVDTANAIYYADRDYQP